MVRAQTDDRSDASVVQFLKTHSRWLIAPPNMICDFSEILYAFITIVLWRRPSVRLLNQRRCHINRSPGAGCDAACDAKQRDGKLFGQVHFAGTTLNRSIMRRETVSKAEGGGKFQMFATPSDAYQDRTGEEITGHLALRTSNFYFLFSASRRPLVMVTFSCLAIDPRRRVVAGVLATPKL